MSTIWVPVIAMVDLDAEQPVKAQVRSAGPVPRTS